MASPPTLRRSLPYPRIPKTGFQNIQHAEDWARGMLRALDQNTSQSSSVVGVNVISPGSYPYSVQTTDLIVLVDTSSARTILLPGATAGFKIAIKDATGTAAANNITIQPIAGEFIDGAATYVMGVNFQAANVLATGIAGNEWVVV